MGLAKDHRPLIDRLTTQLKVMPSGCWEWTRDRNQYGYGRISVNNRKVAVHRLVYEIVVGSIPQGLQLDHLCRNRACANPAHLEPVTAAENMRRTISSTCRRGHDKQGKTRCRQCGRNISNLRYRIRKFREAGIYAEGMVLDPNEMPEPGYYPDPDGQSDGLVLVRLSVLHEFAAALVEQWDGVA